MECFNFKILEYSGLILILIKLTIKADFNYDMFMKALSLLDRVYSDTG